MKISLCIPTLNKYDLLVECILSAEVGTLPPTGYYIIDNGGGFSTDVLPERIKKKTYVFTPHYNLGVAASWNIFVENLGDYIIISNDDVKFYEDTLERLVKAYDENYIKFPAGIPSANSFSCFLIPKKIVADVGYFDETISPNYAYYEDNDYHYRMLQKGYTIQGVSECRLDHFGSATLKAMSPQETEAHHKKFKIATQNYIKKWGGLPNSEIYTYPYNIKP